MPIVEHNVGCYADERWSDMVNRVPR